jgi:hypothetical protein
MVQSILSLKTCLRHLSNVRYWTHCTCRALREAIGGDSKTLLVFTLSPDPSDYQSTISALEFATAARG